jgi:hypothetical protein
MQQEARSLSEAPVEVPASTLPAPVLTYVGDNTWRLEADYSYQDGAHRITVPAGFRFDLSSVPRALWWLIAPFELSISAPLVHDFMYQHDGRLPAGAVEPPRTYSRREADDLFRRMMKEEGVAAWRRVLAYAGVRLVGGRGWTDDPAAGT